MERLKIERGCIYGFQKGFTLIELLLVMVILTVLAAVVVPKFTKRSEQARVTAANTDISNLEVALDAFEVDVGRYPTSTEGMKGLLDQPTGIKSGTWKGPYIKKGIPSDPWGNAYVYTIPGKHNTSGFDLHSYGPDGEDGGDDDIVNWSTTD